ncbi:MAG TPA: hypothetical protein VK909_03150 [Anaerolineales bacterium]|nr:hypothetical protein [Anaerolineales bacterium]
MATKSKTNNKKKNAGRAWKNERASVSKNNTSRPKSNKYSGSDKSKREENAEQYWRAGYTRADGTKVKGHYVKKKTTLIEKIVDALT